MEVNDRCCFRDKSYIQTLRFADGQGHHIVTLHQQVRTLHVPTNSRASIHYLNHDEIRALLAAGPGVTAKSRRNRMLRRSLASARQVVGGGGVKATWVGSPLGIPRCRSSGSPYTPRVAVPVARISKGIPANEGSTNCAERQS